MSPDQLPQPDLVLDGATVLTMGPHPRVLHPGRVSIAGGRIIDVGPAGGDGPTTGAVWSLPGRIVLPGFVNTHAHLVSALTRGLGGDRFLIGGDPATRGVADAIREGMDGEAAYAAARLALTELLLSGVTTTTDSQAARRGLEDAVDGTLRALTESGMRGHFYRASVDRSELVPSHRHDDLDHARTELTRLHERWSRDRIRVGAEAMSAHRVTPPLLRGLHEWAVEAKAGFAMHISYSEDAARHSLEEHGRRLMTLLADWGVLDERFLGYHPVWLDADEIGAIAAAGAGVSVCAGANMLIGVEAAPVDQLVDAGVRLGLGTDQPNDAHDFFQTMKTTILHQRASRGDASFGSPEMMLMLATRGGARALHMEDEVGSIEVGKQADLVILDGRRAPLNPLPAVVSNLVYAAGPSEVETVLVAGETVVERGRVVAWEIEDVVAEANRVVAASLARAGLDVSPISRWDLDRPAPREEEE